jgi:HCOMODA/2-hydroxy-3-carboxy-muconic semialdehyde decarboxylase
MPSIQSAGPVDPALIDDLVAASRILAQHGVLDAWGHVSMRHPKNPERYLLSRARAPALVSAADIMEFDLNSDPVDQQGRRMFLERYIHGEAFRARPDVNAVVHSHSPTVIPFTVTDEPLRAVSHIASFLAGGCPCFEIRDVGLTTGLLVTNNKQGAALAKVLGDGPVALMRGHGNLVVASDIPRAVHRALYTEVNAQQLAIAHWHRDVALDAHAGVGGLAVVHSGPALDGLRWHSGNGAELGLGGARGHDVPPSWDVRVVPLACTWLVAGAGGRYLALRSMER